MTWGLPGNCFRHPRAQEEHQPEEEEGAQQPLPPLLLEQPRAQQLLLLLLPVRRLTDIVASARFDLAPRKHSPRHTIQSATHH